MKKGREKGEKEKSDKTHVKIPLRSLNGWPEYIPLDKTIKILTIII